MTAKKTHSQRMAKEIAGLGNKTYQSILGVIHKYDGVPHREAKKSAKRFSLDVEKVASVYTEKLELEDEVILNSFSLSDDVRSLYNDFTVAVTGEGLAGYDLSVFITENDYETFLFLSVHVGSGVNVTSNPLSGRDFVEDSEVDTALSLTSVTTILERVLAKANRLFESPDAQGPFTSDPVVSTANITEDEKADWALEVSNGDTVLGLGAWVGHKREADGEGTDGIQVSHIGLDYGIVSVIRDGEETEYEVSLGLAHALKRYFGGLSNG